MKKRKVIVIGGGAAGLMAAGQAAETGADVLILEKMSRPARKLCITGKGRCNITNIAELREFISHFGKNGNFLRQAFHRFFAPDLMEFLESQGLPLITERGGRVFPKSGKAPEVTETLIRYVKRSGVTITTSSKVDRLLIENDRITGVVSKGEKIDGDAVILATGGSSYPLTGSTGDGYEFAKSAGHKIIPIRPALVPLETTGAAAGKMTGLNLRNINVSLFVDGKKSDSAFGELVFAEYGLTGPVILTLSGKIVDLLRDGRRVELSIDLKPALDEKKLDARLIRDFTNRSKEPFRSVLRGLMAREMVPVCIEATGIPGDRQANQISAVERKQLRQWLKNFRLEISGNRPIKEAIVTAGGIETKEINPKTMESKIITGLFVAGEVIDIDADTGGYNLQAAFSTGWLAGTSSALGLAKK
jgi:predicted Rossmann fold flavoprotein